ncbi:hypothetical protein ACFE04_028876 [Oxalis oulophora]
MDPQAKTVIISPEADDEGYSIQNKASEHRLAECSKVEKEYKRLEEERRRYAENIEKIRKIQPIIPEYSEYRKWHPSRHRQTIGDILAWKNDILIIALEALNASISNKQSHNLQIIMRHSKRSVKGEKKILKDQVSKSGAREQPKYDDAIRNSSGHEKPSSNDAFQDAIRAMEKPENTIRYYEELVRCHCWKGDIKRFIPPHIRREIKDIKMNRNKWMVGKYYTRNYWKLQPDEEQLKKLLQINANTNFSLQLMCIIRRVTESLLVGAVHEDNKYVNNEYEKLIASLEKKLADSELQKAEVGKFMSKWKNDKISRLDDHRS